MAGICMICHDDLLLGNALMTEGGVAVSNLEEATDSSDCSSIVATACGHVFHQNCLREWSHKQLANSPISNFSCPLCRKMIHMKDCRILFLQGSGSSCQRTCDVKKKVELLEASLKRAREQLANIEVELRIVKSEVQCQCHAKVEESTTRINFSKASIAKMETPAQHPEIPDIRHNQSQRAINTITIHPHTQVELDENGNVTLPVERKVDLDTTTNQSMKLITPKITVGKLNPRDLKIFICTWSVDEVVRGLTDLMLLRSRENQHEQRFTKTSSSSLIRTTLFVALAEQRETVLSVRDSISLNRERTYLAKLEHIYQKLF